jgi:hypothetical protein
MAKIRITNEQYSRLILKEHNSRILNESEQSLNTSNDILLGLAKIMDVNLSGFNLHKAENIIKDSKKMLELKKIIQNPEKRQGLIDDLNSKGMINPNDKVLYKSSDIADNFNKISKENGFEYKIDANGFLDNLLNNQ